MHKSLKSLLAGAAALLAISTVTQAAHGPVLGNASEPLAPELVAVLASPAPLDEVGTFIPGRLPGASHLEATDGADMAAIAGLGGAFVVPQTEGVEMSNVSVRPAYDPGEETVGHFDPPARELFGMGVVRL